MKNFFYLICLALSVVSCSSTRHGAVTQHPRKSASTDPVFLDNITIRPSGSSNSPIHRSIEVKGKNTVPGAAFSSDIESCTELQFKYAILMEEPVERVTNARLISFLEEWYGIPYKFGGQGRTGIDCSAFSSVMLDSVYHLDIPRTCKEQYVAGRKIGKNQLMQGDLVFFNTSGRRVSHVGVYLGHNKFVHASTSSGVMISDLDESYFKRRYVGSTRIR